MSAPLRVSDDPVALLEIGDAVGERRERERVRAEIHFAVAIADRQRRALARADQQILLALEQIDERERAAQPPERRMNGLRGVLPLAEFVLDDERRNLGIGLGRKRISLGGEFLAQRPEILDDAVVNDREPGEACGWALFSVGLPCVAQRVWPMPIAPLSGAAASFASRFRSLPSARRRSSRPFSSVATPAES